MLRRCPVHAKTSCHSETLPAILNPLRWLHYENGKWHSFVFCAQSSNAFRIGAFALFRVSIDALKGLVQTITYPVPDYEECVRSRSISIFLSQVQG